ncbi:DUF1168 domain-containing protein [Dissoconium aciculare CBS 342.82]|jgi:hypothetical protein|uniref:DUF1168 domain-containing protein n=1 Tax=Dissoconium aciculare CBS 342.82 TaxID=1314786 RepID=A0A6J3MD49_9PEZI|nr:DUF1168 domain-containing protein [Dissoconium aciculare CBS 342.82]KAF1825524.1 DUF1168 domain-containing protein [Dissoconium aciculare CBS 342.82]
MSEPIPESIPTSALRRARPPKKKVALTPAGQQSAQVEALFANPDRVGNGIYLGPKPKTLAAIPEIIASVQGSSAGAGSGEFHVYKASRRREYERLKIMDEENQAEEADQEFQARKSEREQAEAEKLEKNRSKREKMKQRQQKKKLGTKGLPSVVDAEKQQSQASATGGHLKRKLEVASIASPSGNETDTPEPDALQRPSAEPTTEEQGITIHDED